MKRTFAVIAAATLLSLLLAAVLLVWPSFFKAHFASELFELTYQFLLFVVIGGLLSLAYRELQRQRDETATIRGLRREFLTRAIDAYNAAKKVRRLLRARARQHDQVTNTMHIRGVIYDEQMQLLVDAQLRFETLKHLAESDSSLFPGIATALESMEDYLGKIVEEYEEKNLSFAGQPPALPLASLVEVKEFMAPYQRNGDFNTRFKRPFRDVVTALQRLIAT